MTEKKRPGTFATDDERALEHLKHRPRTPAGGVPVSEFAQSKNDFTPVREVIDRIERTITLDERDRLLIHLFWEHTANMTMRWAQTDTAQFGARIDDLETSVVDISGASGNNGKLGALKERVDKAEARKWAVTMWVAGLAVAIVSAAIAFGTWKGGIESDVESLKQRVFRARNVSPPEYPASKEAQ